MSTTTFFKVEFKGDVYLVAREKHPIGRTSTRVFSEKGETPKHVVRRIREAIESASNGA